MFRKLIACMLVFFFACSPAYASNTTGSLYSLMTLNDDIMTASATVDSFKVRFRSGSYNVVSDSYDWGTYYTLNVSDGSFSPNRFAYYETTYSSREYQAVQIEVSNFGSLENLRLIMDDFYISTQYNYGLDSAYWFYVNKNGFSPFTANAAVHYTGTIVDVNANGGQTYVTSEVTSLEPLSALVRPQNGTNNYMLLDVSLPVSVPDVSEWDDYGQYSERVENVKIDKVTITLSFIFGDSYVSSAASGLLPVSNYFPTLEEGAPMRHRVLMRSHYASILSNQITDTSGVGSGFSALSNAIQTVARDMATNFSEVKQTISQGAADLKNEISDQTTTLTDKLADVKDGIVQGVTELKETTEQGFEDVVQGITDLPDKMQEMLTEFIVPDEDAVADKMTDFQDLAEEKLGIIYQVPEMMFDAVESLVGGVSNPQSSMTFPAFSLPWIDGSQLKVWDSQQFDIIPAGLDNLRDLIQTVTSMVFVIMTFNSLKRAYERFFLGGDD